MEQETEVLLDMSWGKSGVLASESHSPVAMSKGLKGAGPAAY